MRPKITVHGKLHFLDDGRLLTRCHLDISAQEQALPNLYP